MLRVGKKSNWKIHSDFLYDLGIRKAESEIVLLSQADIPHDYGKIRRNIRDALHGMVGLAVLEHPHIDPWNQFVTKTLQIVGSAFGVKPSSGVVAFSKVFYLFLLEFKINRKDSLARARTYLKKYMVYRLGCMRTY